MTTPNNSEDVLSLLDSLGDSPAPPSTTTTDPTHDTAPENEKELLGFLDDLAKRPSRSQTPRPAQARTNRDSTRKEAVVTTPKKTPEKIVEKPPVAPAEVPKVSVPKDEGGGWLGGLWSMGSAAMKTA